MPANRAVRGRRPLPGRAPTSRIENGGRDRRRRGRRSGFGLMGISSNLVTQTYDERVPAVMSENNDLKYVGIVAAIIGGTVLVLGLAGIALTLS